MLPPVLASPSSYATATDPKQRLDQPRAVRPATLASTADAPAISQNSTIAGQLNIMLLSGPERMSQNLATLAEVLGSALKIERSADESLNDYMGRLIEGIASLPPADRLKLQKLLSQAFAGLQLRTLLEAMKSPSGPERATLALYLELYRQTDRDGGARSVISSYREVAAEARANPLSANRPIAANDTARPATDASREEQRPNQQPLTAPPSSAKNGDEASVRSSAAGPPLRPSPGSPSLPAADPSQAGIQTESTLPEAASRSRLAPPSELRALDQRVTLRQEDVLAPPSVGIKTTEDDAEQAAATSRNAAASRGSEPSERSTDQQRRASASAVSESLPGAVKSLLPIPAAWVAELLESDLVRTLLQLKTLSFEGGKATQQHPISENSEQDPEPQSLVGAEPSEEPETNQPSLRTLDAVAARYLLEDQPPLPVSVPVDQGMIRSQATREGVPLPFVTYLVEDDARAPDAEEQEDEEDEKRRRQNGSNHSSDGEQEPEAGTGDEPQTLSAAADETGANNASPAARSAPENEVDSRHALPAPSETAIRLAPEPAHELYLRMAGLT